MRVAIGELCDQIKEGYALLHPDPIASTTNDPTDVVDVSTKLL